ncbi:hypothetical protein [Actinacidiphila glaucinigra]|uniref:hypothetical protein n=1 Tax=Actinacidiphila glaucinigra TaxID=235986 RepID=UPI0035D643A6
MNSRHRANLKGATSAEEAIEVGGKAPEAWKAITSMVGALRNIRDAQYDILRGTGDDARYAQILKTGHGEVRGLNPDDVPERILESMRTRRYDVGYLLYLASIDTAYVPGSFEERDEEATVLVDTGIPDGPLLDYTLAVTAIPTPPAPERHGFEQSPDISLK